MGKIKKNGSSKARMTMIEKYKIQQMLGSGKEISEIASSLERTEETISKYIETELKDLVNSISPSKESESENIEEKINIDIFNSVINSLKRKGIEEKDAINAINKVKSKINEKIDDVEKLSTLCMKELEVHNAIIREAINGQKGVTIMTKAASEIIENKRVDTRAANRRNSFYKPQQNG